MLTKTKSYALCMFAHSRLRGKSQDANTRDSGKMIVQEDASKHIQKQVNKYAAKLEKEKLTIDHLNMLPDSLLAKQLTYYYEVSLKTMNKYIKKGDEIVEAIIGLSIISYLEDEKQLVSSDVNTIALIEKFEKLSSDRKLNTLMLKVGTEIVDTVSKASYINWSKQFRRNKKMKQNRKRRAS